jgi:hypothetical protein
MSSILETIFSVPRYQAQSIWRIVDLLGYRREWSCSFKTSAGMLMASTIASKILLSNAALRTAVQLILTNTVCGRDQQPTQKRLAEAETPNPDEAEYDPQLVVLASIDLRSQHRGRLVSAKGSASIRKGVLGSCNRAASQAAGRAYRIVLQRSRP